MADEQQIEENQMKKIGKAIFACCLMAAYGAMATDDSAQVNEAAVVFDGVKPSEMRGGGNPPRESNAVAECNPPFGFAMRGTPTCAIGVRGER